jgi:hypothetical protein
VPPHRDRTSRRLRAETRVRVRGSCRGAGRRGVDRCQCRVPQRPGRHLERALYGFTHAGRLHPGEQRVELGRQRFAAAGLDCG